MPLFQRKRAVLDPPQAESQDEVFAIVYSSTAAVEFSDADVAALLEQSRRNNTRLGITGLLLLKDGQFMQALEGPEPAVRALVETISHDPRHTDFWTLAEEQTPRRQFPQWTMGYQPLSDETIRAIPGYDDFFEAGPMGARAWATKSRALWLLDWFRTNHLQ
ncbi:BLUF domain-containing protein [Naasia lichenicola]|uniref:BLUF domain-containing protein n=1 Tax=Naasia lichenicola TaxID=2565933 RepID=UPI001E327020|nr:BLUF domain-containing protein [Naasia lichenicola]